MFLLLTYCKSEVDLSGQKKVLEGTVAKETIAEGALVA